MAEKTMPEWMKAVVFPQKNPTQTSGAFAEGEERLERGSGFDACDKASNAREVATK